MVCNLRDKENVKKQFRSEIYKARKEGSEEAEVGILNGWGWLGDGDSLVKNEMMV